LYRHDEAISKPTKEGPLSYVLFESPFTPVSTASKGHPSLVTPAVDDGINEKPRGLIYACSRYKIQIIFIRKQGQLIW
jgi:hypothetical protein